MKTQPEHAVLDHDLVFAEHEYALRQLPDQINFIWNGRRYRTITYPKYNTMNRPEQSRPCLNLVSLDHENIPFSEVVKVI